MVDAKNYEIPYTYRRLMTPEEQVAVIRSFKNFDKSGDGKIEQSEFKSLLKDMGRTMALLRERHAGQMDFGKASALIKTRLTGG